LDISAITDGRVRKTANWHCVPCSQKNESTRLKARRAQFDVPLNSLRIVAPTRIGAPCKRGHDGTRYVSSNQCVTCKKNMERERYANPEVRAHAKVLKKRRLRANGKSTSRNSQNRPPWMTPAMDQAYYNERNARRDLGIPSQVDHFYPRKGRGFSGLDVPWNLIVIDEEVNAWKNNKHPRTFYGKDFEKMSQLVKDTYEAVLKEQADADARESALREQTDAEYSIAA